MLGKLIKHEFKAMARIIPFIYLALAFLLVVGYVGHFFKIGIFTTMGSVLLVLGCIASLIFTTIAIIARYYKSMFGQEGYLTQTLPVSKSQLVLSKAIVALTCFFTSLVVSACTFLAFLWYMGAFGEVFQSGFNSLLLQTNLGGTSGLIAIISVIGSLSILQIIFFIVQVYLASTIANVAPFNKLGGGGAFLYYIAINFIIQIVETVVMLFVPLSVEFNAGKISLGTKIMGASIFESGSQNTMPAVIGLGSYIFEIIAIVAMIFLIIRLTAKKVSLK